MKISLGNFDENKNNQLRKHYVKLILEQSKVFLKEYDINRKDHSYWPLTDTVGISEFALWLTKNSIVSATPYWFKDDSGELVVIGLDIEEDKKFTHTAMIV